MGMSGPPLAHRRPAPQLRRVLFVFPPTGRYCREDRCQSYFAFDLVPSMRPPLEEAEAAGGVRRAGGTAQMVDAPAEGLSEAETLARVVAAAPDIVCLTTTFGSLADDLAFAAKLREALSLSPASSAAVLGLRGAPCYVEGQRLLAEQPCLDFLVRGDYELAFESLVREGRHGAVGFLWRDTPPEHAGRIPLAESLDDLPLPDRSILDATLYRVRGTRRPQATVHVQRGCPFPCTYCLVARVSGTRARHRSPQSIAREVKLLWSEGYRDFYLRAETFTLDRHWALETAAAIGREAPGARWVSTTRAELLDEETARALARGGCYGLSFGVETGSKDIGRRIRKPPSLEAAQRAFRACDAAGIASLMYVLLGFVWETPATLGETEAFIRAARPDLLTFYWAHPYPGTPYFEQVRAEGLVPTPRFAQAASALEPPAVSLPAIQRRALWATARHYARPLVVRSLAKKLGPVLVRGMLQRVRGTREVLGEPPLEPMGATLE